MLQIKLFVVFAIVAHFVGDWLLQSRYMAINKSKKFDVLVKHLIIVHLSMLAVAYPFFGKASHLLVFINTVLHGIIDWNVWKIYKQKFSHLTHEQHYNNRWFYNVIAIDQCLHLAIFFLIFL